MLFVDFNHPFNSPVQYIGRKKTIKLYNITKINCYSIGESFTYCMSIYSTGRLKTHGGLRQSSRVETSVA